MWLNPTTPAPARMLSIRHLCYIVRDALSQRSGRVILWAWRLLKGMLARLQGPQREITSIPTYNGLQLSNDQASAGTVGNSSNEVIKAFDIEKANAGSALLREEKKRHLRQTTPSSSLRYQRKKMIDTDPMQFTPEVALLECHESPNPPGWKPYIHPEGQIYWHNFSSHIVTEANIQEPGVFYKINDWLGEFTEARDRASFEFPNAYELLLELDLHEDGCCYYVVDHDRQTIFYLDDADTELLGLPDVCSREHLKLQLQEQYWIHMEYFPMHGTFPVEAESTMVGILAHAWGDQRTSSLSTAPYSAEQCKDFVNMLDGFRGIWNKSEFVTTCRCSNWDENACYSMLETTEGYWPFKQGPMTESSSDHSKGCSDQDGYRRCMISRLMNEFLHSRFINLYGQDGARLARNQSTLPEHPDSNTKILRALSVALLYQPHRELEDLKALWVDKVVYTEHWRVFISAEIEEWRGISLLSAILLVVDTIMIVYPMADTGASLPQASAYNPSYFIGAMSLLFSMSTVVASVATNLIHRPYPKGHASQANAYLERASHEVHGLYPLAILLSLPRALFLWALGMTGLALLFFTCSFLDPRCLTLVGIFATLLCFLLIWVVRFFRVRGPDPGTFTSPFATFPTVPIFLFGRKKADEVAESA